MSLDAMADVFKAMQSGNPNVRFGPNNRTMLHAAIMDGNSNLVRRLLQQGADPSIQGNDGASPLIIAAAQEQVEMVRMLLRADAKPWLRDHKGFNALDYASMDGEDRDARIAIIYEIAAHPTCDIDSEGPLGNRPSGGGTALFKATVQGEVKAVRALLSLGARTDIRCAGTLPRDAALEKGHREIVRLFDNPPELSPQARGGKPGHNLLRLAREPSADGHQAETVAAMKTPVANRTQRQVDLIMTMASTCAVTNQADMLELMLKKNRNNSYRALDLGSADFAEGFTILHDAAGSITPNEEAIRLLLRHGADPTIRNKRGLTPLDVAEGKCQDLCAGTNPSAALLLRQHMAAAEKAADEFAAGTVVTVHGLKKRADLNGQRGVVVSGPEPNGRWKVQLDEQRGGETIGVLPANLEMVSEEKARKDAVSMLDDVTDSMQSAMLESVLETKRTGDYEVDSPMEEATRLIMGTMNKALRDEDHATVMKMLSDEPQAKVDAVVAMHKSGQLDHTPPGTKTQSRRVAWTPMENTLLKASAAQFGPEVPCRWDKVAEKVGGGKTATECKKHLKALGK